MCTSSRTKPRMCGSWLWSGLFRVLAMAVLFALAFGSAVAVAHEPADAHGAHPHLTEYPVISPGIIRAGDTALVGFRVANPTDSDEEVRVAVSLKWPGRPPLDLPGAATTITVDAFDEDLALIELRETRYLPTGVYQVWYGLFSVAGEEIIDAYDWRYDSSHLSLEVRDPSEYGQSQGQPQLTVGVDPDTNSTDINEAILNGVHLAGDLLGVNNAYRCLGIEVQGSDDCSEISLVIDTVALVSGGFLAKGFLKVLKGTRKVKVRPNPPVVQRTPTTTHWIGVTSSARSGLRSLERQAANLINPATGKLPGRWNVLKARRELDSARAIVGPLGGRLVRVSNWMVRDGRKMEFDKIAQISGRSCITEDKSAHSEGGAASKQWMRGRASFISGNFAWIRHLVGVPIDCFALFLHETTVQGGVENIVKNAQEIIGVVHGIDEVMVFVKNGSGWIRHPLP